ncbi:MAG: adenylate/guanylate cyclase domain-containing protein [Saprospiraceae bacterium]|nr:adenylate/guanylate cyclase domain-containing protein [Saprospiraceae bacterium]
MRGAKTASDVLSWLGSNMQAAALAFLLVLGIIALDSRMYRPPIEALQTHIQDLAFYSRQHSGQHPVVSPEEVVIILMDDESIERLGHSSLWSRAFDAKLVEFLADANPKALGVDFLYSEPDTFSNIYKEMLAEQDFEDPASILRSMSTDPLLESALAKSGKAYLSISSNDSTSTSLIRSPSWEYLKLFGVDGPVPFTNIPYPRFPIERLAKEAKANGSILLINGPDRVVRYYVSLAHIDGGNGQLIGNMPMYMALDALGITDSVARLHHRHLYLGDLRIPVRRDGAFRLNWLGDQESIRTISFHKVIEGKIPKEFFNDKYVFVGHGASGQSDLKTVPSRADAIPGVEVHATAFLNLVNQDFIHEVVAFPAILILALLAVLFAALFGSLQPRFSLILVVVICLVEIFSYIAWFFPTFSTTLPIVNIALITIVTYMFSLETARKRLRQAQERVTSILNQHVSGAVADRLLSDQDQAVVDRKFVCIMFLDIRDFTGFAESRSAEEIIRYQNQVFGFMIEEIEAQGGIISQIMGDGFMAVFGVPQPLQNCCASAYRAGIGILETLEQRLANEEIPPTRVGIGLHAGNVVAGNVGTEGRKQYSITGNPVIIAARLEQLNKQLGSTMVLSKGVYDLLPTSIVQPASFKRVDIRGRKEPMIVAYS